MKRVEKLALLAQELLEWATKGVKPRGISRSRLRELIVRTLKIRDAHAVNSWITTLVAEELIAYQDDFFPSFMKLTNDTAYSINENQCKRYKQPSKPT